MFEALGGAGIPIRNITTSEIRISCLVPQEHGELALRLVHGAFGLERGERVTLAEQLGTA
jgi:aspartate kinase